MSCRANKQRNRKRVTGKEESKRLIKPESFADAMAKMTEPLTMSPEEERAVECILDANGISLSKFQQSPDTIQSLELFLVPYNRMIGLEFFPGLGRTLTLLFYALYP